MKYISAEQLIDIVLEHNDESFRKSSVYAILTLMPPADVIEVKHGEWKTDKKETVVRYGDEYEVHIPYCSECGWKRSNVYEYLGPGKVKWNFCPECGADMRERKESKVKKCFDIPKDVAERLLEGTEREET